MKLNRRSASRYRTERRPFTRMLKLLRRHRSPNVGRKAIDKRQMPVGSGNCLASGYLGEHAGAEQHSLRIHVDRSRGRHDMGDRYSLGAGLEAIPRWRDECSVSCVSEHKSGPHLR